MIKLSDKEWKEFFIGGNKGIFLLRASKSGIDKNKLIDNKEKHIPYITRSDLNNGISLFIYERQNPKYNIDNGNVITIGLDTQTAFYQPYKFYTGQNIQILDNSFLNKYNALFIVKLLKIQLNKFNWGGNGATLGRLEKTKILLPITQQGEPDYQFMEDYIKELIINKKRQQYIEYIREKIKDLEIVGGEDKELGDKEWKEFRIGDIFILKKGKCYNSNILENGNIPYIGATNRNNGVLKFSSCDNSLLSDGNCIVFIGAGDGSAGYSIYKYEKSINSSSNICGYNKHLNKYVGLFISCSSDLNQSKYSHGYSRNLLRLSKDKILLPITQQGEPDYKFMEDYTKRIILKKYNKYLEHIMA